MTQTQEIDLSKELTEQYRNKTLPAGEYYFCIGKSVNQKHLSESTNSRAILTSYIVNKTICQRHSLFYTHGSQPLLAILLLSKS